MAGFGTSIGRPIYGRGPSPGLRFTVYAILSLTLMHLDQRARWSEHIRYGLEAAAYPVQVAVNSPLAAWHWMTDSFSTRGTLRTENKQLHTQIQELQLATLRQQALEHENAQLRELQAALPPLIKKWLVAEVIGVDSGILRQRLIINKGKHQGVQLNEPVVDSSGILGQVAHIGPWSSEVILITDPEHAIPVQVARNGLRTIAVGAGNADELLLPYLAANSDVKSGDLLTSSGLGGVFPAGYPVGHITGVRREANQLLAQVRAEPQAKVDRTREVMLIEFDPANPAAPPAPEALIEAASPAPVAGTAAAANAPPPPNASRDKPKSKSKGKNKP
ncbi:MAG TPA: rod shape-determining protein MreC [Steroidobacteraceae bacterium]|nr:rod shape-determining protein MreC [Steroidobacteraceae bacterium]